MLASPVYLLLLLCSITMDVRHIVTSRIPGYYVTYSLQMNRVGFSYNRGLADRCSACSVFVAETQGELSSPAALFHNNGC
jgi:hypothetical protein